MNTKPNQFSYGAAHPIPEAEATRLVKAWANRRGYPCGLVSITEREVVVFIHATNSKEHNRSVNSLARVLDRCVNRAEWERFRAATLDCESKGITPIA